MIIEPPTTLQPTAMTESRLQRLQSDTTAILRQEKNAPKRIINQGRTCQDTVNPGTLNIRKSLSGRQRSA